MIVKTSAFEEIYTSLHTARASLTCSIPNDPESPNFVRDIVVNFVESLDYRPRDPISDIRTISEKITPPSWRSIRWKSPCSRTIANAVRGLRRGDDR